MAKKKNNSSKYIKFVVAVVLVIAVVFGIYYLFLDKNNTVENETISETKSVSISETFSSSKPKETEKMTAESTSAITAVSPAANPNTTTKQAKNYELPLSINQALNALEEHYGSEYNINATIEEDGINYFALYKDDEKYASIAVNLSTGEATETIMETNQKTDFYLV